MRKISSAAAPVAVLAVLVLAGCPLPLPKPTPAEPQQTAEKTPAVEEPAPFVRQMVGDADRLMSYYAYLSTLSSERLVQEHERTLRFYRQQYSDFTLMQLVLQRIMPQAPFRRAEQVRHLVPASSTPASVVAN